MQDEPSGRVFFHEAAKQNFLFLKPRIFGPQLKVLQSSVWTKVEIAGHGAGYRAPTSVEALEWLRDNLGSLLLSKDVHKWYKRVTEVTPIQEIEGLPLFDFQREGVGFLVARDRAMLSLSPGLGKTLVSSTAANLIWKVKKVLVVAPLSLLHMWRSELEKWGDNFSRKPITYVWHGKKKGSEFPFNRESEQLWIITNPETAVRQQEFLILQGFDLIILDESIYYKNRKAERTKTLLAICKTIKRCWLLTGAPATRAVDDLWSQFHIINPTAYRSYWRFAESYCIVDNTPWSKQVAANKKGSEEVIKRRFRDIYFARNQDEVLDLPDWIFESLEIPMTEKQEKHYTELQMFLRSEFVNEEDEHTTVDIFNHLAKIVRLIQVASNPMLLGGEDTSGKWDALPELLKLYQPPFIFWTTFISSAKCLLEKLQGQGLQTSFMIGETQTQQRQKLVDNFQEGKLDAIILGQAVGSHGLTLTAARTAFYLERTFDGSYFQSLHRFRRIGTKHHPVVLHLKSVHQDGSATVDQLVDETLDYRVQMVRDLTIGMVKKYL